MTTAEPSNKATRGYRRIFVELIAAVLVEAVLPLVKGIRAGEYGTHLPSMLLCKPEAGILWHAEF